MRQRKELEAVATNLSRREFVAGATALVLGVWLSPGTTIAKPAAVGFQNVEGGPVTPHLFIRLQADGTVELTSHRSEMGQKVWTSLAQILAEELEVPWESVRMVQAPGNAIYGDQNTDGSRSIRRNFHRLRLASASMRTMLEQAAAKEWGVAASSVRAVDGAIVHEASGRRMTYAELAPRAADLPVPKPSQVKLKERANWEKINKPLRALTTPDIVRGKGTFGQDVFVEGMKYAVIARPPQVLGSVASVDDSKTLTVDGVERTVRLPDVSEPVGFRPLGGVAVIANDTWAAIKGREALDVQWNAGPNASYDSAAFKEELFAKIREPGEVRRKRGDVSKALGSAAKSVAAEYYVPHLAHAAMEPPAVVAKWTGDEVECWGCIQAPQAARKNVAEVCGVPLESVTINVTWLGGGFGRKSKPDHFAEAAWLAREVGAPVKVVWTREDATQHSYYHTVSAQRLEGALDANGKCTAFLHRTVFPPISSTFRAGADSPTWGDLQQGASDAPFAVPNLQLETGKAKAHVRTGWLRSVANIYHAFAIQSFVAELAHAAGRDPKDFLLEMIGPPRLVDPNDEGAEYGNYGSPLDEYPIDTGRLAAVTRKAAEMAGWGRDLPEGHGLGIAAHRSFTSYVATVVEVKVDAEGRLTIPGVWSVIDAGTVVNPNHVEHQMEGGTLFGLSNAMFGEITAKNGAIVQANFPEWRQMRMHEAPRKMEVHVVPSTAPPGGVGEPPTPPAAPALTNAIFAATGVRVRDLPIFDSSRKDRIDLSRRGGAS